MPVSTESGWVNFKRICTLARSAHPSPATYARSYSRCVNSCANCLLGLESMDFQTIIFYGVFSKPFNQDLRELVTDAEIDGRLIMTDVLYLPRRQLVRPGRLDSTRIRSQQLAMPEAALAPCRSCRLTAASDARSSYVTRASENINKIECRTITLSSVWVQ